MTDLELLFLVFGMVYLWECACWAQRGGLGFRTWLGRGWRPIQPAVLLGNQQAGIIFAPPLPPLGTLVLGHPWPVSVSADAVLAYIPPSASPARRPLQTARFFAFDQIERIEATGKRVRINGQLLFKASTAVSAVRLTQILLRLKQAGVSKRKGLVEEILEGSFDTKTIEQRWRQFHKATVGVRLMANVLFLYLFAAAPVLVWRFGLSASWMWVLVVLLLCSLTIAIFFQRAHKVLYPSAQDERFTQFLIVLLSPASAIRAHDVLARPLLEGFHPVAIARLFCTQARFFAMAGEFLRELRFPALPRCPCREPTAAETERFASEIALRALERFLRRNQMDPQELLQSPMRADQTSRSFCPRCLAQFTAVTGICQDCGGVALVPFCLEANLEQSATATDQDGKGARANV